MIPLPQAFTDYTRALFGEELFARFLSAMSLPAPVSIRINPFKVGRKPVCDRSNLTKGSEETFLLTPVPWCEYGFYLNRRPDFTFDPLLHAGCYYVQEASSMFVAQVIRQYVQDDVTMLDLCAAPGGKSTCVRSFLTPDSLLVCNEPVWNRASILAENIGKFGTFNTFVTSKYAKDFTASFDVILADVPCSGEGMFRKDEGSIQQWSPQNVEKCWRLQREIIADIWNCLVSGGLLIYSTCTFNTKENEENVRWICSELGAEVLPIETELEWNIIGSLLKGYDAPVYRFIPGMAQGEGFFLALLRKNGEKNQQPAFGRGKLLHAEKFLVAADRKTEKLSLKSAKNEKSFVIENHSDAPVVSVDYPTAISYLRREAIRLPEDAPRGMVRIAYKGFVLGRAKNLGIRANNLYPKEWAIRTTHIPPQTPSPIQDFV